MYINIISSYNFKIRRIKRLWFFPHFSRKTTSRRVHNNKYIPTSDDDPCCSGWKAGVARHWISGAALVLMVAVSGWHRRHRQQPVSQHVQATIWGGKICQPLAASHVALNLKRFLLPRWGQHDGSSASCYRDEDNMMEQALPAPEMRTKHDSCAVSIPYINVHLQVLYRLKTLA